MKKNYSEPAIKVQTIALQSMIAVSGEGGIKEGEYTGGDAGAKDNLLDDWDF